MYHSHRTTEDLSTQISPAVSHSVSIDSDPAPQKPLLDTYRSRSIASSASRSPISTNSAEGMFNLLQEKVHLEKQYHSVAANSAYTLSPSLSLWMLQLANPKPYTHTVPVSAEKHGSMQSQSTQNSVQEIKDHSKSAHGSNELNVPPNAPQNSYRTSSDASISIHNPNGDGHPTPGSVHSLSLSPSLPLWI